MNLAVREFYLRPIGVVRSPFRESAGTPIQGVLAGDAEGSIELALEYTAGLKDLEGFERIWILFWCDRAEWRGSLVVTPYLDTTPRGVFATRAPSRPNRLGLSCVRLVRIEGSVLTVRGLDVLDGTLVLDLKPYVPKFDSFPSARAGWLESKVDAGVVADDRFESK